MNRPQEAGQQLGKAIIEMIHLMYQNNTALSFLQALVDTLSTELTKRENNNDIRLGANSEP